ncbi:MAG: calcium/sodium antiporter [Nanoarchaeota archaeon]|nr:calcium/sodium antiporter [Nanoarchaeota archaeon]
MGIGLEFLILGIALVVLVKGSGFFVSSASSLAKHFGVSDFVIGLTVVALGTSLPELASSIVAALTDNTGLIIGNIVGSNIANIGLVLAVSAIIVVLEIKKTMFRRDGLFLIIITVLFFIFALNKVISRLEGIVLYTLFMFYIGYLLKFRPSKGHFGFRKYFSDFNGKFFKNLVRPNIYKELVVRSLRFIGPQRKSLTSEEETFLHIFKNVFLLIIGGVAIFYGAKYLIPSAANIATYFKVPQDIIGLVFIAIGTSLPELFVCLAALKKGLNNILVGNILGSNIANILFIGGVSAIITPLSINVISLYYTIPFMILMTFMFLNFIRIHWLLRMFEGLILLFLFILFIVSLVLFF